MPSVTLIDNYDSFTFNLVHYLGSLGADVTVWRNDARSVDDIMTAEHRMIQAVPTLEFVECSIGLNIVKRVGWELNPDGTVRGALP